jgi:PAS domain S-box-containing protein
MSSIETQHALTPEDNLGEVTCASRVERLEWLLKGVLEVQSLITEAEFDLTTFMQRIVDVAETLTDARGAVVELVDGDDMVYRSASRSISQHVGLRLQRSNSLSGLCVAEARVLLCEDSEHDPRVDKEACRQVGVRSMVCTPLFQTGLAVGVLKVMGSEPNAFDSNDQYLLGLLAGALGAALGKQLALEALKTSEETFRSAMETTSIGMALVKPNCHFLNVNPALCELLGYSEAELLANDVRSITHQDDHEREHKLRQSALKGELSRFRIEKRYYHKAGRTIWVLVSVALVRDAKGAPSYFVDHIQDLTEQREMDRMKSEFISMVSHELRTPLTSIRGALGLILGAMAQGLPEKMRRLVEIAHSNAERLILLINDLLDIDKFASGQMRFDLRDKALAPITAKAIQANEAYAEKFKARIQLAPIDPRLGIRIDEDRYIQVLSNLLSNAAKFSPAGGTIVVTCELRSHRVRICIADEGPGIPVEFRSRIFGKFCQADSSAARRVGGTGLGLHIARQMVEQMNGSIGFDTEIGRGTTFWIEFPALA